MIQRNWNDICIVTIMIDNINVNTNIIINMKSNDISGLLICSLCLYKFHLWTLVGWTAVTWPRCFILKKYFFLFIIFSLKSWLFVKFVAVQKKCAFKLEKWNNLNQSHWLFQCTKSIQAGRNYLILVFLSFHFFIFWDICVIGLI